MADEPRWTVITGASSGIGAELARVFAARGSSLVLTARRHERLEALGQEITAAYGVQVEVMALDLADREAPHDLAEMLRERGIVPHTLVNNAGFGLRGSFATMPYERQIVMIELNVTALTALCRLMLPGMIERGRGGILNVASLAAFQAGPYMAVYYATKAFVLSLSEALHDEAKPHGVTVTALCPGPTESEFSATADLENSKLFKMGTMSAAEVARLGVEGYEARRAIVVTGARNRLSVLGAKFAPRSLSRWRSPDASRAEGDGAGQSRYRGAVTAFPSPRHLVRQFSAFFGVGVAAAVAHYGLLVLLVEGGLASPVPATLAGYVAGGLVSYALNRTHTYRSTRPHREATWRFALVALVGFLLTWAFMHAFVVWLGAPYLPAQLVTTGVVMLWSFLAHRTWTFA